MVDIVTLINFKIHAFMQNQVSLKPLKQPLLIINKFILLIVRELNRYYVGTVASSEVSSSKSLKDTQTSQSSVKTLPSTGDVTQQYSTQLLASLLLVMGTSLLLKRKHHSHSY